MNRVMTIYCATSALVFAALLAGPATAHGDFAHALEAERKHHFEIAAHHLRRVVSDEPRNAQAWLILASLETVRGDMDAAREACSIATQHLDPLVALACRGRLALADAEDKAEAYARLERVLSHPAYAGREDRIFLWAVGVAAELAVAVDNAREADRLFEQALVRQAPVYLQAAYLDHLLATARPEQVLAYVAQQPRLLALELRRALALVELKDTQALVPSRARLHETFQTWMAQGDFTHGREMAMFYLDVLDRPALAATAATENLKYQREPEDKALYERATGATNPL